MEKVKISLENASLEEENYVNNLEKDKFDFVQDKQNIHDQAFETKPISYLHDCFNRFRKNKSSIVAAIIILIIILYALIVPFASPKAHVDANRYPNGYADVHFSYSTPYLEMFKGTGFWDGTKDKSVSQIDYYKYKYDDSNHKRMDLLSTTEKKIGSNITTLYNIRLDTYAVGNWVQTISKTEYDNLVKYEKEKGIYQTEHSILKPLVDSETYINKYVEEVTNQQINVDPNALKDNLTKYYNQNNDIYYEVEMTKSGNNYRVSSFLPVFNGSGDNKTVNQIYKKDASGNLVYAEDKNGQYEIRVDYFDYFTYLNNGMTPYMVFGSNAQGQDIFLRLATGARFSLLLGIGISAINFLIGLIWGAVSGYYGGTADLIMERVTDIISNVPSIIILTICQIQFVNNLSLSHVLGSSGIMILAILVAFVYNGWVGVASTTRMQFYRFKGQEYVLASRTLGAKDRRLIFKHILPNAIGTLVTASVLMIPGVIFSESSLSYLGIINFQTSGISSIGTLLDEGQKAGLSTNPHVLLFPALIISLLMICFNLFGNGLRDAFNTSLKGSED